jgi:hypothetical protein
MSEHFRALAWGVNRPINEEGDAGAVLWFTVRVNGRLHVRAEWPFQQTTERALADQVRAVDRRLQVPAIALTVAAPAIFPRPIAAKPMGMQGECISERLALAGLDCVPGDDDALNGWARVQALLAPAHDGQPRLTVDASCAHLIQALGSAMSQDADPDLLMAPAPTLTALRLGVMSRPSLDAESAPVPDPPVGSPAYYIRRLRADRSRPFGGAR